MGLAKKLYRRCAKSLLKDLEARSSAPGSANDTSPSPESNVTMQQISESVEKHIRDMDSDPEFKRSEMRRGGKNFLNLFFTEPIVRKMVLMAILEKSAGLSYDDLKEP